ncbi:NAD-dependent epimerase/dehydratase family protein [Pseudidiomarina sp. 1APP75-27a]|uniref:UDP-2-acetamido-2,6-beta-L-arabino-hexul-4-ose reductase n=1 Tax=Pseudidiomarina terrestris TaxID=2820060 RepID=UPI002B05BB5B|nr:NAD-dependent epimerase/dehydratase family protein [Pseudidiomarina sp. 1APP75-27a]MEA3587672.1 NAD-dependent epimerase/dehydratase family protein [Pseudidiomarina sp. 1APP75-27a]
MKLLITGATGFVGTNLTIHLDEIDDIDYVKFTRDNTFEELPGLLEGVDCIVHLAGVNRPKTEEDFAKGNSEFTNKLLNWVSNTLAASAKPIPVIYSSSIQAECNNPYGLSKRAAEQSVIDYGSVNNIAVRVYRLANVFGKWCRPNYNSMVATFCHNVCRDLPIQVNDEAAEVQLVYIDDVCAEIISMARTLCADPNKTDVNYAEAAPVYRKTVGQIAMQLEAFKNSRDSLISERVGDGFTRKLYSTYISYLPTDSFSYRVPQHGDERGVFVEMLKTKDSGQFSFFTAHPGITRGGHYHHTKNEKFLVIKGKARFEFRHMVTDEHYELITNGDNPEIVETAPGWSHDITNIGNEEMVVMLWANEIFDRQDPDTFAAPVKKES